MLSLFLSHIFPPFSFYLFSFICVFILTPLHSFVYSFLPLMFLPAFIHSFLPLMFASFLGSLFHSSHPFFLPFRFSLIILLFCQFQSLSPAYSYPVLKWKYVCVICGRGRSIHGTVTGPSAQHDIRICRSPPHIQNYYLWPFTVAETPPTIA